MLKVRHKLIARFINKLYRIYWWILKPTTSGVKLILTSGDKILLVRLTYYPNTWTFLGGGVEKNELPEQAIVRECKEEIGIDIFNPTYIGELSFKHEYKNDTVYVFSSNFESEAKIISDDKEIAEVGWFNIHSLPQMGPNAKKILDLYSNNSNTHHPLNISEA